MCTGLEPALIGSIASAAGGGLQFLNQANALKRQDRETARGIAARSALSREAGGRVQQEIANVASSTPDAERKSQTLSSRLCAIPRSLMAAPTSAHRVP